MKKKIALHIELIRKVRGIQGVCIRVPTSSNTIARIFMIHLWPVLLSYSFFKILSCARKGNEVNKTRPPLPVFSLQKKCNKYQDVQIPPTSRKYINIFLEKHVFSHQF